MQKISQFPKPSFWLWGLAFLFTSLVALLIQKVLLPFVIPHLHAGHGLILNTDSPWFQREAMTTAREVLAKGWQAWSLFPPVGLHVGILSFLYVFFPMEPWLLIPLNAAVHALSFMVLVRILNEVFDHRRAAICGALPFLLMATPMSWYSQIHREGYYILGFFVVALSCLNVIQKPSLPNGVLYIMGLALIWMVRPIGALMVLLFSIPVVMTTFLKLLSKKNERWKALLAVVPFLFFLVFISKSQGHFGPSLPPWLTDQAAATNWTYTHKIPRSFDNALALVVAEKRKSFSDYPAESNFIDKEVKIRSTSQLFAYIPRALQIGLFAPFPNQWVKAFGNNPLFRSLIYLEMMVFYLGILSLVLFGRHLFRNLRFWSLVSLVIPPMILIGSSITIVGAIHRYRFGQLSLLAAMGFGVAYLAIGQRAWRLFVPRFRRAAI